MDDFDYMSLLENEILMLSDILNSQEPRLRAVALMDLRKGDLARFQKLYPNRNA